MLYRVLAYVTQVSDVDPGPLVLQQDIVLKNKIAYLSASMKCVLLWKLKTNLNELNEKVKHE